VDRKYLSATVKELLKSDSTGICQSYAQVKKGPDFFLTHSVVLCITERQ